MSRPDCVEGWRLWLPPPDTTKKWINLNDRNHWGKKSPLTRYWRGVAREKAAAVGFCGEFAFAFPHVTAFMCFGDNRRRDVHNYMPTVKACVDGCTDAGWWLDDRDGILTGPDMRRAEDQPVGVTLWVREFVGDGVMG